MVRKYCFIILSIFPLTQTLAFNFILMSLIVFWTITYEIKNNPFEFTNAYKISLLAHTFIFISLLGNIFLINENTLNQQIEVVIVIIIINIILLWKWIREVYHLKKVDLFQRINSFKKSLDNLRKKSLIKSNRRPQVIMVKEGENSIKLFSTSVHSKF